MSEEKKDIVELKNKPVFKIYPETFEYIKKGFCPTCGMIITGFRDSLSRKEYEITGVCQTCQDRIAKLS